MTRAIAIALLLLGCADAETVTALVPRAPATQRERLRDDARLVLEANCGQCHIHDYDTALPRALAVFDLSELEWSAHMSDVQLIDAAGRVAGRRGPDGPLEIDDDDVARVRVFVDEEIALRQSQGPS